MRVVAIIGAGELGGALAHILAGRGRVQEVRLIDESASIAAGKALDIQQAGSVEQFATRVTSSSDVSAAAGAAAIVVADQAGSPASEWQGEAGLALIRRLSQLDHSTAIVCAGAAQHHLVVRGVTELGVRRERLLGSAPEAFTSAVRAVVALEAGRSPAEVSLCVLGVPPDRIVVPWTEGSIGGALLTSALEPNQLARLDQRLPFLWPPALYALASAAARVCEAIALGSRKRFCGFAVLDGEFGVRGAAAALPLGLGAGGIQEIVTPSLSTRERVLFDNAIEGRQRPFNGR